MKYTTENAELRGNTIAVGGDTLHWSDHSYQPKVDGSGDKRLVVGIPRKDGNVILGIEEGRSCSAPRKKEYAERRLDEIERLIEDRFKGPCVTDDGGLLLQYVMRGLVEKAQRLGRAVNSKQWAQRWVPVFANEQAPDFFDRYEEKASKRPYRATAITVGTALRVTWAEVTGLGLRTMRALDRPAEDVLKARKREQDRERQRQNRLRQGRKPRHLSDKALKPWEAEGLKERTWRRRKAKAKADAQAGRDLSPT